MNEADAQQGGGLTAPPIKIIYALFTLFSIIPAVASQSRTQPFIPPSPVAAVLPTSTDPFAGFPLLRRISACESTGSPLGTPRQFLANGSILLGISPITRKPVERDEGILQINTWVWGKLAASMGDDLATESGNIAFGKYLFNTYGSSPWNPSKLCWQEK